MLARLPFGPRFAGPKPAEVMGFLTDMKIHSRRSYVVRIYDMLNNSKSMK
jgi:hypothetical protein